MVLRPRSISWLLPTWLRAHHSAEKSRAEQRWLYLQVFGSKGFLGPMQCLVSLISDDTLLYIFFQFKVPYTGVVGHQNTVSIA